MRLITAPIIGGADKIAFLEEGEIWAANLDGSELVQLTRDGSEKAQLQWSPDGLAVHFISGKCVLSASLESGQVAPLVCFDLANSLQAFEISPDGQQAAIGLDGALYVIPFRPELLGRARSVQDLQAMAGCAALAPYLSSGRAVAVKSAHWSRAGEALAIVREGVLEPADGSSAGGGQRVDLVHILDLSRCTSPIRRLDEFPGRRFKMSESPTPLAIQNFAWDGDYLFALIDPQRNGGFGDLWVYSTELHRADRTNPIAGVCCYRDPQWSPDGRYLLFAFQDKRLAPQSQIRMYYAPLATVGTGLAYAPLPLPEEFFAEAHARPQAVLRPAR
jgi:Tol biopolymer transport system component